VEGAEREFRSARAGAPSDLAWNSGFGERTGRGEAARRRARRVRASRPSALKEASAAGRIIFALSYLILNV
jgi:hypothetical protein